MSSDLGPSRRAISAAGCGLFVTAVTLYASHPFSNYSPLFCDHAASCQGAPIQCHETGTCDVWGPMSADCQVLQNIHCDCDGTAHGEAGSAALVCDAAVTVFESGKTHNQMGGAVCKCDNFCMTHGFGTILNADCRG